MARYALGIVHDQRPRTKRVTACTECRYEVSILQLLHIVLLGVLNFKQVAMVECGLAGVEAIQSTEHTSLQWWGRARTQRSVLPSGVPGSVSVCGPRGGG